MSSYIQIDLNNLASNYNFLQKITGEHVLYGAAVKANAYGIGAEKVIHRLNRLGCENFFVAHLDEALQARSYTDSNIYYLHGPSSEEECKEINGHRIIPVLNSLQQVSLYNNFAKKQEQQLECVLHFDTGMNRLGIDISEIDKCDLTNLNIKYVMSHLACADEPSHTLNQQQLNTFLKLTDNFPGCKFSLANSSGIFLGSDYHFQLVRPGCALYGINPTPTQPNPMQVVVSVYGKIIQKKILTSDSWIGYGASVKLKKHSKLFIVEYGYADGYIRALSNKAFCYAGGMKLPIVGRVSMDLLIIDASALTEREFHNLEFVELIGKNITLESLADQAGTIGYEIFTSLSRRFARRYVDAT